MVRRLKMRNAAEPDSPATQALMVRKLRANNAGESELPDIQEEGDESNAAKSTSGRIRVVIRLRPSAGPNLHPVANDAIRPVEGGNSSLQVTYDSPQGSERTKRFDYDAVLPTVSTQTDVFGEVGMEVLNDCLNGINGAILAFGQTGAGKTYSLLHRGEGAEEAGLLPRLVFHLFVRIARDAAFVYEVDVAAAQVYNEQIDDLLHEEHHLGHAQNIAVQDGGEIPGLTWVPCEDPEEMLENFSRARANLVYAETKLNKASSRSHAIFQVRLKKRARGAADDGSPHKVACRHSKLVVVDLAGSERVKRSGVSGAQLREALNINRSLLVLGNVMSALARQHHHVPIRDSKLTRLLEGHIGGNCRTVLLVCASPEKSEVHESLSSLQFASRAMCVKASAQVNWGMVEVDENAMLAEKRRDRKLEALRHQKVPDVESSLLGAADKRQPQSPASVQRRGRLGRQAPPSAQQAKKLQLAAAQAVEAGQQWQAEAERLKESLRQLEQESRDEAEHLRQAMICAEELTAEWQGRAESEATAAASAQQALSEATAQTRLVATELAESRQHIQDVQSELEAARREADELKAASDSAIEAAATAAVATDTRWSESVAQAEALARQWQSRAERAEDALQRALAEGAEKQTLNDDIEQRGAKELASSNAALVEAEAAVARLQAELEERERELEEVSARSLLKSPSSAAKADRQPEVLPPVPKLLRSISCQAGLTAREEAFKRPSSAKSMHSSSSMLAPPVLEKVDSPTASLNIFGVTGGSEASHNDVPLKADESQPEKIVSSKHDEDECPEEAIEPIRPSTPWVQSYMQGLGCEESEDDNIVAQALSAALRAELPQGWVMHADQNNEGIPYFWNSFTGKSSWTHPDHERLKSMMELRALSARHRDPKGFLQRALSGAEASHQEEASRWEGPLFTEAGDPYWRELSEGTAVWHDPVLEAQRTGERRLALLHAMLQEAAEQSSRATTKQSEVSGGLQRQLSRTSSNAPQRQGTAWGPRRPPLVAGAEAQSALHAARPQALSSFVVEEDSLSRQVSHNYALFTKGEAAAVPREASGLLAESPSPSFARVPSEAYTGWRSPSPHQGGAVFPGVRAQGDFGSPLGSAGRRILASSSTPSLRVDRT